MPTTEKQRPANRFRRAAPQSNVVALVLHHEAHAERLNHRAVEYFNRLHKHPSAPSAHSAISGFLFPKLGVSAPQQ